MTLANRVVAGSISNSVNSGVSTSPTLISARKAYDRTSAKLRWSSLGAGALVPAHQEFDQRCALAAATLAKVWCGCTARS